MSRFLKFFSLDILPKAREQGEQLWGGVAQAVEAEAGQQTADDADPIG